MNSTTVGSSPPSAFVDVNDMIYVASPSRQEIQVWFDGSSSPSRTLGLGSNASYGIFAAINGDIFVDNGGTHGCVDRWVRNFSVSVTVMFTSESCMILFIDTYDRLYCSLDTRSRIIRTSLLHDINRTEPINESFSLSRTHHFHASDRNVNGEH